jgi:hypothetical protein
VRLVRGDFGGARADCARLVAGGGGESALGLACLAESYAGSGQFEQALALLAAYPVDDGSLQAAARAYLLAVRGELRERSLDLPGAIEDYRRALALAPRDDSIRASLADALVARGERTAASAVLEVERPSLALQVRQALAADGAARTALAARAAGWLALEKQRGDAAHHREAAMLALGTGYARAALAAAQANFALQKELPDVRVLARAALAARDVPAQAALRAWLRSTGFVDAVTENILAGAARG